ncbi:MAG TPA: chorismate mutase [Caulobacteraceae bacterium]|jgi:hypothetical protein|nr:chorismate mutase [Caulobacteraceae bacterium]
MSAESELLHRLVDQAALTASGLARADPVEAAGLEQAALRAFVAGAPPSLPLAVVVRIWRDLMAAARLPINLAAWGGPEAGSVIDFARLRFGAAAPLILHAKPEAALAAARTPGVVAVLALDDIHAWWGRLLAEPRLKVFAALPCLASLGPIAALAVADTRPEPSGNDMTFWVTDVRGPLSAVEAALAAAGVAGELLIQAGGLRLFALHGFYQEHDPRLAKAPGRLSGVIGAASAPLDV